MNRKETFSFLCHVALCAEQAANTARRHREYQDLRLVITKQEGEHRALGRSLVGDIGAHMTVKQACDYFVAQVLVEGIKSKTTASLDGLRLDYVMGAILVSNPTFRDVWFAELKAKFPDMSRKAILAACVEADYSELVAK